MSLQIPQYLVGGRRVREEHAVAQAVEGLAQRRKAGGRGAVDRRDAEALGEPVLGGQPVPLAAQLVVVGEVGPAGARAPRGDIIRKQPGEPQAVVTEVRPQQEAALARVVLVADLGDEDDSGERGLLLRAHLGNYSLWLAGLFPDYIAARRTRAGGPDLPYYDELGRQGYRLASEHRLAERFGVASIYRAAAARFPALRQAFNRLSDRVFFPDAASPDKILRNL